MRLKEDGQFYNRQLVYPMNTTTLSMRVTETEVIWSWDGFAEGINTAAYSLRKAFEFVPMSNATELKHKINTATKTFYPIIISSECGKAGDFSSFEIIDSKIGKD